MIRRACLGHIVALFAISSDAQTILKPGQTFRDCPDCPEMVVIPESSWAVKAGAEPVAMFNKYPGRFPLWHVKDLDKNQKPAEVGTGSVDFKTIFAAAKKAGLKCYFVEQDTASTPLENISNIFNNLRK